MWWHSLPSLAIIGFSVALPTIFTHASYLLVTGTGYGRRLLSFEDYKHFLRDRRLINERHSYTQVGLEALEEYCNPPVIKEEECTCPPKKA